MLCLNLTPKLSVFSGSHGRSDLKGNGPAAPHLFLLNQKLGNGSLCPGSTKASNYLKRLYTFSPPSRSTYASGFSGLFPPPPASESSPRGAPGLELGPPQYFQPNAHSRLPAALRGIAPGSLAPRGSTPAALWPSVPADGPGVTAAAVLTPKPPCSRVRLGDRPRIPLGPGRFCPRGLSPQVC